MPDLRLRQTGLVAACVAALVACDSDSPTAPSDPAPSGGGTTPTTLSVELSIGTVSSLRRGLTEIGDAMQTRRIAVSGQVSAQGGPVTDLSADLTFRDASQNLILERQLDDLFPPGSTLSPGAPLQFEDLEIDFDIAYDPVFRLSGQATVDVTGRDAPGGMVSASATVDIEPDDTVPVTSTCTPNPTTACVFDRRFKVEVDWQTSSDSGMANVVPGRRFFDGAEFSLANSNSSDLLVQLLNSCSQNDHFWVFASATTDIGLDITVTDTQTGVSRPYTNPLGSPFQPIQDTAAFATCP